MTAFKNYIIIFGGFQDTSQQTKYLQDIWLYDTQTFKWITPTLPPASGKPDARSSFSFLPHDSGAVIYGGYSRVKANAAIKSKGGKANAAGGSRVVMKPMLHQDTCESRLQPLTPLPTPSPQSVGNAASDPPTLLTQLEQEPQCPTTKAAASCSAACTTSKKARKASTRNSSTSSSPTTSTATVSSP
jgi:hypothetical protein